MSLENHSSKLAAVLFITALLMSISGYHFVSPNWKEQAVRLDIIEQSTSLDEDKNEHGSYLFKGKVIAINHAVAYQDSPLSQASLDRLKSSPKLQEQIVYKQNAEGEREYFLLKPAFHLGFWSLLAPFVTIALCLLLKEPITALFAGIVIGAVLLGRFDLAGQVIIPTMAQEGTAAILLLYLWLLGGLLGIWSRTGASQAFADYACLHWVKGPRSAKLVTWCLGIIFFQGGTISTVLVGTTVRPLNDKAKVSHEESSYIVDSTASPIASVIAFNPWPAYVQALIFIPGVSFLATETDRIAFFFKSIPLSFYSIFAVLGTLLLSLNITKFSGKGMRQAIKRVEETGKLDSPTAMPLSFHNSSSQVPQNYKANPLEFVLPIVTLIAIAVSSYIFLGVPKIAWAFAAALTLSIGVAAIKGMRLRNIIDGISDGLKSVVTASVILVLAITIGQLTRESGGGLFLIELLGSSIDYRFFPVLLMLFTMLTAFSTGTSWGTYAIAFPLAFPLAWAMAQTNELADPELFLMICFAAILNGSVFGDQCSPISDSTVLSAMTTGCDLMDHVKTQLVPASIAATLAMLLWTLITILFV